MRTLPYLLYIHDHWGYFGIATYDLWVPFRVSSGVIVIGFGHTGLHFIRRILGETNSSLNPQAGS